ncbi:MAG: hypothetical protein ACLUEF_13550 [Faecalibacterium prausnitzii]
MRSPTGAGIIGPARCGPVLYSYVGRRGVAAGVWRAVLLSGAGMGRGRGCCPLLYAYVGRGGVRSPTGAASSARRGRRRGVACPAFSGGGRGIIGPARPVRGDLSSGAGCCCPLLYSYVGRRGAISYRRGHHLPGVGGGGVLPVQTAAAAGCDLLPARHHRAATGKPPTENAPRKTGNKKEVDAAAGRVYLFFRVILSGRSFFRGVVRGGRLESIAGHSFPRGVYDIPRHAFPGALCRRFHLLVFFRHQSRCNCLEFG